MAVQEFLSLYLKFYNSTQIAGNEDIINVAFEDLNVIK